MAKDYSEDQLIQKSTAELLEQNLVGNLCTPSITRCLANKEHLAVRLKTKWC